MTHSSLRSPFSLTGVTGLTILSLGYWLLTIPQASALTAGSLNANNAKKEFYAGYTEAQVQASGAARVTVGNTTLYIGTQQVAADNQNPIVASYTNGVQDWAFTHEATAPDSRGIGLLVDYSGSTINNLYAAFTTDGGSNDGTNGIQRFTSGGWLTSYGSGGGVFATVLLRLDPTTGNGLSGTFVRSQLTDGTTNTLIPKGLGLDGSGNVVLTADAYFAPLNTDKTRLDVTGLGSSPFTYTLVLSPTLSTAVSASVGSGAGTPVPFEAESTLGILILGGLGALLHRCRRGKWGGEGEAIQPLGHGPNPQEG